MIKKYSDELQMKIEARLLRSIHFSFTDEQWIGSLMLSENLFYKEALERYTQAKKELRT